MRNDSNNHSRLKMVLADIMTSNIIAVSTNESVRKAAQLMKQNKVGSIILKGSTKDKNPLGILTERDIVTRVVAEGKDPAKTTVAEIATKPVITASPAMELTKAMELMARMNIRRLIIVENNLCVGIVTYRDLLHVAPSLLEIAFEYEKIGFGNKATEGPFDYDMEEALDRESEDEEHSGLSLGFYCSHCGEYCEGSPLYDTDDQPICSDCYNDLYK
ncbi:MAG: hypothetical protein DRP02_12520 [Candidatus Gerdarchaeota archaeon]|nr:MAG: hypothetical protein DRO63_05205 [Candidatus Gerdarchaeota archaeon]RLI68484.1 MAG: hypothetical protein DRP02_12520 [Candidatus Gerdarchaeota archaeon]